MSKYSVILIDNSTFIQLCLGVTLDLKSHIGFMILINFGTLLLDLISKMASKKKRKSEFEVPIAATTISMVVTALQRLIAVCFVKPDNYICTFILPNTLKWIVVQKIIVHLANEHNELKILRTKRYRKSLEFEGQIPFKKFCVSWAWNHI